VTGALALAQHPNCGTGIAWALDLGGRTLGHGAIQQLQRQRWSARVHLKKGTNLNLILCRASGDRDSTAKYRTYASGLACRFGMLIGQQISEVHDGQINRS